MGPGRARRIVQIAATVETDQVADVLIPVVYALADDGTVWGIGATAERWRQLPELPDEETP